MFRKPTATPIKDKKTGRYRLQCCIDNRQYKRCYIADRCQAYLLQEEVNHRVKLLKSGLLQPPPGKSLPDFIFENLEEREIHPEKHAAGSAATLRELVEEYRRLSGPQAKAASTRKTEGIHLDHLGRFLRTAGYGDLPLKNIGIGLFDHYKLFRYGENIRIDTVNKELGTFQCLFEMALRHGHIPANPLKNVRRDKSEASLEYRTLPEIERLRNSGKCSQRKLRGMMKLCYLDAREVGELVSLAVGTWLHPWLMAYSLTGMRKSELAALRWEDVDLKNRVMLVGSRKQSRRMMIKKRRIPICGSLLAVLERQRLEAGDSEWVLQGPVPGKQIPDKTLENAFRRLVAGTRFEGVGFHVFRRSVGSLLLDCGEQPRTIEEILGHESGAMRKRYQHVYPERLREAMDKLDKRSEAGKEGEKASSEESNK